MATEHPTTRAVPRDPPPQISTAAPNAAAAALAVGDLAPSPADIGRHIAATEAAYDAFEALGASVEKGSEKVTASGAAEILIDRTDALRLLITTVPAKTLADVAAHCAEVAHIASQLAGNRYPERDVEQMADRIERMMYSALPVLAAAAGLDMTAMGWIHNDALRVHRFAGVGVTS
jgi:hypothetical protein